jgi:Tfp pilus assembly protein PilN
MRELEFLPEWYPQSRRRKRLVKLQGYMTLLLAAGLGVWLVLVHRNTQSAAATLAGLQRQISQTHQELRQLKEQVELKNQLMIQRQIVDRLGLPVEMSRLLHAVDQQLPESVSLTNISLTTREQLRAANTLTAAQLTARGDSIDRRVLVRIDAVAPTDDEVANFLSALTHVPVFQDVAMNYSRDRSDRGRTLRDFEITFSVNLSQSAG